MRPSWTHLADWRDQRPATFFHDEIQVVPGWEAFARRLLDSERIDLFLSGSSVGYDYAGTLRQGVRIRVATQYVNAARDH